VNTCIVTEKTERKILQRLQIAAGREIGGSWMPASRTSRNRSATLHANGWALIERISGRTAVSDLLWGTSSLSRTYATGKSIALFLKSRTSAALSNIAKGCNGVCSYCIVRMPGVRLVSRKSDDVVCRCGKSAAEDLWKYRLSPGHCSIRI